jgi:hypothetical protein
MAIRKGILLWPGYLTLLLHSEPIFLRGLAGLRRRAVVWRRAAHEASELKGVPVGLGLVPLVRGASPVTSAVTANTVRRIYFA